MTHPTTQPSEGAHTPGPWAVFDEGAHPGIEANTENGSVSIVVYGGEASGDFGGVRSTVVGRAEALANARLIAAAPDLLENLRLCWLELDYCQRQLAAHGQTGRPNDSVSRALAAGATALAKATGKEGC